MLRTPLCYAGAATVAVLLAGMPISAPVFGTGVGLPAHYDLNADFEQGVMVNVNDTDTADQLQLNSQAVPFDFIWVSVSTKGTVVKIATDTGAVLGEYRTAPDGKGLNPSRTTVDANGSAWVTNRDEQQPVAANAISLGLPPVGRAMGSVTHIGLLENGECVDRNANGTIDTSTGLDDIKDWSNAGGGDTLGGVTTAADECIIHYVRVNSTGARHVSVDQDNNVWVSGTGGRYFDLIDGATGHIIRQEQPVGYGGYGGLIDGSGVIWSARPLLRWDTELSLSGANGDPAGLSIGPPTVGTNWAGQSDPDSYGLCINGTSGEVWNTGYGTGQILRYAPDGTHLGSYWQGNLYAQGCVVDRNGHVWIAHSLNGSTTVGHLGADGTWLGNVTVGSGPTGVAVDGKGRIWATNYSDGTVSRIDPALNGGIGMVDLTTVGLGGLLYNYSDMTGSTLIAPPSNGTWSVVHDTAQDPERLKISWTAQTPADSALTVAISCSSDNTTFGAEVPVANGVYMDVSECRYVKAIVSFTRASGSADAIGASPILYDLGIATNAPPDCTGAAAVPALLWSPNHQFVPVAISGVTDPDGDALTLSVTGIRQDEAVNAKGSGNTTPDGKGIGTSTAEVRAERVGGGNGRVYHIGFTADDGSGGTCSGQMQVGVPHDQGKGAVPVDDGPNYDSTLTP